MVKGISVLCTVYYVIDYQLFYLYIFLVCHEKVYLMYHPSRVGMTMKKDEFPCNYLKINTYLTLNYV